MPEPSPRRPFLPFVFALVAACGRDDAAHATPTGRPVTVLELAASTPQPPDTTIGVVEPYRQQAIGFDVPGRIEVVEDLGRELRGPTLDDANAIVPGQDGDVVARIDATRYELALQQAQLSLASAERGLEAQLIEADIAETSDLERAGANARIAEQDLAAAAAVEHQATARLARTKEQFDRQIASQAVLDADQASADAATASLESARQGLIAQQSALASARAKAKLARAQVERGRAEIAELQQRVATAQQDRDDCTLRAPFAGRITAVHTGRGGTVQAGGAVVTLTAMNPMQVSVTVSGEQSRRLVQGAKVALRPRELDRYTDAAALYGVVFGKAEIADAATRTFRIDIIARNLRRSRTPREVDGRPIPAVDGFMPVMREDPGSDGPLYVGADCVAHDGDQPFVLLLPEFSAFDPRRFDLDRVLQPRRVDVRLEADRLTFINLKFVRVAEGSALVEGNILVRGPRAEHTAGVTLERYDWLLRPGDLVPVVLDAAPAATGIYVPVDAISSRNGAHRVFVVDGDACHAVDVSVHDSAANLRRIEGPGIAPGVRIVHEGAHYVADGDRVQVVDTIF